MLFVISKKLSIFILFIFNRFEYTLDILRILENELFSIMLYIIYLIAKICKIYNLFLSLNIY